MKQLYNYIKLQDLQTGNNKENYLTLLEDCSQQETSACYHQLVDIL